MLFRSEQVSVLQPNEIVVDNEDPQFTYTLSDNTSLLHKLIIKEDETGLKYSGFNSWRPPLDWTLTTNSGFYGLYVRSAYYVKAGTGDQTATWNLPVQEAGNYDIYTYITPVGGRGGGPVQGGPGGGGGGVRRGGAEVKGEYQYFIYHDNGETEQSLLITSAEAGWNLLGSFYLSPENSKVVLTNKSALQSVVADAIKIVKLRSEERRVG